MLAGAQSPKSVKLGEVGQELPQAGRFCPKAVQRWMVQPHRPGVYKSLMVRIWRRKRHRRISDGKGLERETVEMPLPQCRRMCGRVKLPDMKCHSALQARSSIQAHRVHLKVNVQIGLSERGKAGTQSDCAL